MQVMLVQDTNSETTAVSLSVGVGSFQNPPQQQGLAHYLEHMLFLGTEKYPDPNSLQKYIDHNSGRWNAYTAQDHTNYFFSLPSEKLDTALDMFSDYFKAPIFELEYSEKELNAIESEWSMGRSQDGRIMNYLNGLTGNPEHPASRLSVGNKETLRDKPGSVLNEELIDFYNRYYSANIMTLAMVSNKSLEEQEALVRQYFSGVENKGIERPEVTVSGVTEAEMGKKIYYASVKDMKMLMLRFPIENNSENWPEKPNEYLMRLIASEEPGTVAQQLRDKNLVKGLYARVDPTSYDFDGSLDIYADLTDEGLNRRDEVIAAVFAYLDLLREQGIDKKYFLEHKAIQEKQFANLEMQEALQTAIHLSSGLLETEPQFVISKPYIYQDFNAAAIRSVLDQLRPERARIWYVSQNEEAQQPIPYYEGAYKVADITDADIQRWEALAQSMVFNLPAENDLFSSEVSAVVPSTLLSPTLIREAPGLEVWLMHSENFQDQKGRIDVLLNSDVGLQSVENALLAKLFVEVLNSQQLSLIDRAQQAGIGLKIRYNGSNFSVVLDEFNAKHRLLMQYVFGALEHWDVSEVEFEKARDSLRQDLINASKENSMQQAFSAMERKLLVDSWSLEEKQKAVELLTKNDLLAFKKALFKRNRLRVFAYGNYDKQRVLAIVNVVESSLPKDRAPTPLVLRDYITPKPGLELSVTEATEGHTDNALAQFFALPEQSYTGKAEMMVLNSLVKNSFFTQLRTDEQLGYIVGTSSYVFDQYPGFVFYVQTNNTDLPTLKARIDRFRREFLPELSNTDAAVVEQIKQSQLNQLIQQPADMWDEMKYYVIDFYEGELTFDSKQKLIEALQATSKDALLTRYQQTILNQQGIELMVQIKGSNFAESDFAEL